VYPCRLIRPLLRRSGRRGIVYWAMVPVDETVIKVKEDQSKQCIER